MKKLYSFSAWQRPQAWLFKNLLEREGIACLLRNEELFAAMGEIPFLEIRPELWVVDEEVYPRARLILEGLLREEELDTWNCDCGEVLEGQFGACWKCGRSREGEP
jgi:hypothetical protein